MEGVESISSILNSPLDKGVTTAPPAVESTVEPEPKAIETKEPEAKTTARDESGRFAKAAEPDPAKTEPASDPAKEIEADGRNVALRAARERYRIAEARLKELEGQRSQQPKVSIFDNEDEGISQRVAEHLRPQREANFNLSVKLARLTHKEEFEKAEGAFLDAAEADPRLYDQMRGSSDPGEFIMTVGTQIAELGAVGGNFVAYREKVTGELKAELGKRDEQIKALTAQVESLTKAHKELEVIPRSLNKGSESTPRAADADPPDINEIVRFKF